MPFLAFLLVFSWGQTTVSDPAGVAPIHITPGTNVAIIAFDGKIYRGTVGGVKPDALSLQTEAGNLDILPAEIAIVRAAGPFGNFSTVHAPWVNLSRMGIGQSVRVIRTNLSQVKGFLTAVSDTDVVVMSGAKSVVIPRPKIRKIGVLLTNNADKGRIIGQNIGGIAVLAVLLAAATQSDSHGGLVQAGDLVEYAGKGTGAAGSAIGGIFDVYQTIYKAPGK